MKTSLFVLLLLIAGVLPVCGIYWFMVRELLLATTRGRLLQLFVELRAFAVHQTPEHPAQLEAVHGQAACIMLGRDMRHLDMGDVLAEAPSLPGDSTPMIATDPAIVECDAKQLRRMHERFCRIAMAVVLINSPLWFPVIAMVSFGAQWSKLARQWTNKIHRGLMSLVDLGGNPPNPPTWTGGGLASI